MNYIAAFRTRSQTMRLFGLAKNNRIACKIINTPREVSQGCSISLCYDPDDHFLIESLYLRGGFDSLIGFFSMERTYGGGLSVRRI